MEHTFHHISIRFVRLVVLLGLLAWLMVLTLPTQADATEPAFVLSPSQEDGSYAPGDYVGTVLSLGTLRGFFLHVPTGYDGTTPMPLVIALHGGDPIRMAQTTHLSEKADDEGFIVVYPAGRGDPMAWYSRDRFPAGFEDDVTFIRDLIEQLETRLAIDPLQVFATGHSNGGGMAHRLGCDLADRIVAIAPVGGAHSLGDACEPVQPVSVYAIHGRLDTIVPFAGRPDVSTPLPQWAADWAAVNDCRGGLDIDQSQDDVTIRTWTECESDTEVVLVLLHDVGHFWPPGATDSIWAFFAAHPRPANEMLEGEE